MRLKLCLLPVHSVMHTAGATLLLGLVSLIFPTPSLAIGVCETILSGKPAQPADSSSLVLHRRPAQKVIKDPAEYNSYISALNTSDPALKAQRMEAFVSRYPQSVIRTDALLQAVDAYVMSGNVTMYEKTTERIVKLDPNELPSLATLISLRRSQATNESDLAKSKTLTEEVIGLAQRGLSALPNWEPEENAAASDTKRKCKDMTRTFNGATGFGALKKKDFVRARLYFQEAVRIDPANLEDIFQLAVADLQMDPVDLAGLWYCGKAVKLDQAGGSSPEANPLSYCKNKFSIYSGKSQDWEQFVSATSKDTAPPANFVEAFAVSEAKANLANNEGYLFLPGGLSLSAGQGDRLSKLVIRAPVRTGVGTGIGGGIGLPKKEDQEPAVAMTRNGVSAPVATYSPEPNYPKSGRDARVEGVEKVQLLVGIDGHVHSPRVIQSLSPDFDEEALAAIKEWRFKPAMKDGQPVPIWIVIEVSFKMGS